VILAALVLGVGLGGMAMSTDQPSEDDTTPIIRFDSARIHCWHSFANSSGMSVECIVEPSNGSHVKIDFAMMSNGSSVTVDGVEHTGYGSTSWLAIDDPVVIQASGMDSFPDDDRADYFVARVVPHQSSL
jgi:hypothetical protein